ncbi:Nuclear transcription factor Y subunit B-3 [Capsicum annuum]|uniref:Nuclear transcription factor Y subunit B-3 n=1 Tax=Capsicum annuum TaxID=4072 RepID=A0A1U8HDB3_CAPAN|nr:nuclear transcription factor Y subunit B-3 [Capsicum annuum]XP_016581427.1 nuclear transcription factor Y subunit B-3 [Capsicum annuum]XP_016581428.1 nuclear transcription factor Y subunit B-3 [Capsicum annuum]XP_016581429.1 nuclear transcription factor Y subunit B-3 [Capsicum annuum]KAF3614183.1 Nuclear transcription factor Y subunit B-3 [Capsicum annuum]KAF3675137.1 Nuclear transcription factor Y subunit B-3 [Capsicum annuum]PHT77378.1 Nuclear transcription factor Y subunit B-3 [Capsicum
MADSDNESGGHRENNSNSIESSLREQDRFLPIANVSRIMKKALPANAKISKDAKEVVQECVSEFISFITGEASDKCQREKRKTINGDDLLWAMTTLGFEEYIEPLKIYLRRFRDLEGQKSGLTGEKDNGGSVNMSSSYVEEYGMMMMGGQHHQGHAYGTGVYSQAAENGAGVGTAESRFPDVGRPR